LFDAEGRLRVRTTVRIGGGLLAVAVLALGIPGTAGAISANPSSVDYGYVPVNTSSTGTITITVDAGYQICCAAGGGINPPFSFDFDTCGAGGGFTGPGDCTIKETFSPTATGTATGTLTVFECPTAGGSCVGVDIALQGTGTNPSAVTLVRLWASRRGRSVLIRWRTQSETSLLGFGVYREQNGKRVKLNRALIPKMSGDTMRGHAYSFVNRIAPRTGSIRYWLEVVTLSSTKFWWGPAVLR
jgi:hypothetical protein